MIRKVFSIFLVLVLLLSVLSGCEEDAKGQSSVNGSSSALSKVENEEGNVEIESSIFNNPTKGLEFMRVDGEKHGYLVSGLGDAKDEKNIVIPSEYESSPVIGIYGETFVGSGIESIAIPGSIDTVPDNAFDRCYQLKEVVLGEGVEKIGDGAFGSSKLESINLPNSIKLVGSAAIGGDVKMQEWENGKYLGNKNNPYLVLMAVINHDVDSFKVHKNTKVIKNNLFVKYNKTWQGTRVELPDGLVTIGNNAFKNCKQLSSINIPSSLEIIGESAFYECNKLAISSLPNSVNKIGAGAFYNTGIKEFTIPSNITSIPEGCFRASDIITVTIHENLEYIESRAFMLTDLKTVKYSGTMSQWKNISKFDEWNYGANITEIICSDGTIK